MAFLQRLVQFNSILSSSRLPIVYSLTNYINQDDLFYTQKRFAARKGKRIAATREKQRLARQRREEMKHAPPKTWKPKKIIIDKRLSSTFQKFDDSDRKDFDEIIDNVYIIDQFKERKISFFDALAFIRETHDCTLYDEPNALLEARFELDLRTKKKTKFVENFKGIVSFENAFQFGEKRKVVAICKGDEDKEEAKLSGAEVAGSRDLIQMLKVGEINMDNFDDLVCHGDMFIELASIKKSVGLHFPTKLRGNIGFDMTRLVKHFVNGIEFKLNKDSTVPDFGFVRLPFGRLSQTDKELEENLQTALVAVDGYKPEAAPGKFILRVLVSSEPAPEKFAISFSNYI